jgi:hypothetical protein
MTQAIRSKLSRGCVVGLSLVFALFSVLGCEQQKQVPVIDTGSTGNHPGSTLPPPETVKMELTKPSGPIKLGPLGKGALGKGALGKRPGP